MERNEASSWGAGWFRISRRMKFNCTFQEISDYDDFDARIKTKEFLFKTSYKCVKIFWGTDGQKKPVVVETKKFGKTRWFKSHDKILRRFRHWGFDWTKNRLRFWKEDSSAGNKRSHETLMEVLRLLVKEMRSVGVSSGIDLICSFRKNFTVCNLSRGSKQMLLQPRTLAHN